MSQGQNALCSPLMPVRFQTYWPHVDNIYSHRSTQRYKRKPFVSHYWDCRLKGRPPGTPKSDDPNKKKRKRVARERDLCDVKIKITEYEPGSATPDNVGPLTEQPVPESAPLAPASNVPGQLQWPMSALHLTQPDPYSRRIYTIQRVNGNGANGKADGNPGPHKHDLEESDRIKKNSVIRHTLKNEKEKKKQQPVRSSIFVCDRRWTLESGPTWRSRLWRHTFLTSTSPFNLDLPLSCLCLCTLRLSGLYRDIPLSQVHLHLSGDCFHSVVEYYYFRILTLYEALLPQVPVSSTTCLTNNSNPMQRRLTTRKRPAMR